MKIFYRAFFGLTDAQEAEQVTKKKIITQFETFGQIHVNKYWNWIMKKDNCI